MLLAEGEAWLKLLWPQRWWQREFSGQVKWWQEHHIGSEALICWRPIAFLYAEPHLGHRLPGFALSPQSSLPEP